MQVSALLVLLRMKGESPSEIAGIVRALQKASTHVKVRATSSGGGYSSSGSGSMANSTRH